MPQAGRATSVSGSRRGASARSTVPLYRAVGAPGKSGSRLRRAGEISLAAPGLDLALRVRGFSPALPSRGGRRGALGGIVRAGSAALEARQNSEVVVGCGAGWGPAAWWG